MNRNEYDDSDFNMRARFYQKTVERWQAKQGKKTHHDSLYVNKLRKNVASHQKPFTKAKS